MKAVYSCQRTGRAAHRILFVLMMVCGGSLTAARAEEAAEGAPEKATAAVSKVLQKSPATQSMATNIMHKALVQDVVRVGEKIYLAGERGHIGWSDDNGVTWIQAKVPTIQDINALYFVTADTGWAVGHDGNIFNTIDAGKTWTLQLDGLAFNLTRAQAKMDRFAAQLGEKQAALEEAQVQLEEAQAAAKPKPRLIAELEAKVEELDEEVYELDFQVRDAEKILNEENAPWPLMDVWFSDANTGYAVGAFNTFLVTRDGGVTWEDSSGQLDNPDGFHLNAVAGMDSLVFILGEAGLIFRSTDAGKTWAALESPDDGSFFAIHLSKPQTVLIVGLEGSVYSSKDGGDSWEQLENDLNYNLNAVYADDESGLLLIVGNDGAVLRSMDHGKVLTPHRLVNQVTLSSVTVAANGNYILGGVAGIQIMKPDELIPQQ